MATDPLISVDDLAARLEDPGVRVVDCRWYLGRPGEGRLAYDSGHVPGAIHLDIDTDLTAPDGPGRHPLPDAAVFAKRLEALGIGGDDLVVAYDDVGGWVAARLWWMLDDLGHERVAVLDGGWQAWIAAGKPVSTDTPQASSAVASPVTPLRLADHWTRTIDIDALRDRLGAVRLLDARGGARYRGETEPIDAYPGHIPTARNTPTDSNLGPDGRFLPAADLRIQYEALGADGSAGEVIASCGSGVSACQTTSGKTRPMSA